MLRPMLRQWLDENMPRMVTAASKTSSGTSARATEGTKGRPELTVRKASA